MAPVVHAVAGHPVEASCSPLLMLITVGRLEEAGVVGLSLETTKVLRIDAVDVDAAIAAIVARHEVAEAERMRLMIKARLRNAPRAHPPVVPRFTRNPGHWLSLTSPLKHQIGSWRCTDGAQGLRAVNTLRIDEHGVHSAGTDGAGVVAVARLAGCPPDGGAVLRMRGGGGAARSTAHAWVRAGGRLHLLEGRRPLSPRPEQAILVGAEVPAVLGIDFDGESDDLGAEKHLFPRYQGEVVRHDGVLTSNVLDGRWMLVAQHLEAWRSLWAPELRDVLPSISDLMADLLAVEAMMEEA